MKKVLILTFFLLLPISSFAATLEVGSGKTYSTIQAAVDAATAGDTILIYSGTYTGSCTISSCGGTYLSGDASKKTNIMLKANGTSSNRITIKAALGETVIVDGQSTTEFNVYGISRQYYTIQGIIFKNFTQTSIEYIGSSALSGKITGNTIIGSQSVRGDRGIELQANNSTITDNTLNFTSNFVGIDIMYATNTTISGNTITGGDNGIYVHNYTDGSVIEKNTLTGTSGSLIGIFFRDADNLTIRNNLVKGNYSNYMIYYQDTSYSSSGAKIVNNTIHCSGSADGIGEAHTWAETSNNIIYNCNVGIYGINPASLPSGQPGYNIIYNSNYRYYWSGNPNKDNWPLGIGNLTSDPQFKSVGTDYRLQSTSPAINAGDPSSKVPPSWGIVDIGRYEWTSSGVLPNEPTALKVQ